MVGGSFGGSHGHVFELCLWMCSLIALGRYHCRKEGVAEEGGRGGGGGVEDAGLLLQVGSRCCFL